MGIDKGIRAGGIFGFYPVFWNDCDVSLFISTRSLIQKLGNMFIFKWLRRKGGEGGGLSYRALGETE
jgi:hypothetical protein